ncbi:hypothetical protein GVAV_003139 [Gurleya vavrai]
MTTIKNRKKKKIKKQKISNEQKNDQFNLNDNKNLNILKNDQNLKIDDEVSKMEIEKEISKNFNTVLDLQIENYDESKQIKNCDIIIENEANNQEDFKTRKINDDSINNLDDIKKVEFSKSNDEINDVINDEKNENLLLTDTKEKHYDEEDTNFTSENQSILIKPRLNYIVAPIKDYSGDVSVCAWNRSILATGSDDSSLRVYKEGKQIKMKRLHAEITSLAWSENNELSAGNYQGEIFSFNDRNNTVVHKHHLGPVFSMKYFNESLLSVSYDGKAGILNDKLSLIKVHSKSILDCDWIDKNNVLTCSADNDLGLINLNTLEIEYLKGHSNEVNCVSHKNNIIASSSDDTTNILWNITSRQNLILVGHEKSVYSHKWMNSSICSIGAEGGVITWDIETGAIKDKYMHEKSVYGLEYSVENNIIISGGADKNVIFYDDRVGEIKRFYGGGSVYDVKLSGNEKLLCICMADNCPVVLDLRYC